ncbi:MAG: hypothetical protein ACLFUS_15385 [Candidatus Sumerlaeia bacterium]
MIRVNIAGAERELGKADKNWIIHQIEARQKEGQLVCVRVIVEEDGVNMILSTPTCAETSNSRLRPNQKEKTIIEIWEKSGLSSHSFKALNVIRFFEQIEKLF